ncbi:MAG: rod shape-determining protein MreD [Bacillota bacterium]
MALAGWLVLLLSLLAGLLAEKSLWPFLGFYGSGPDFVLILTVFVALYHGRRRGAWFGLLAGLLQDMLFGYFIGLSALAKWLTAYFVGELDQIIYKEISFIPAAFVFFGALFNDLILLIGVSPFYPADAWGTGTLIDSLLRASYTAFFAWLFYRPFASSARTGWLKPREY